MSDRRRRALDNPDVLWDVLQYFVLPTIKSSPYVHDHRREVAVGKEWKTLAYCARISKAFSEAALPLLWRELPSLTPLLSLVFTLTTTENPGNHEYETRCAEALWRSNDSPTQQVLRRFAHFAMFVERISIPHPECIDPTLFLILSEASAGEPLLPMLREIRCSCTVSPFFDTTILSLVGPALRQLIIFEEPRLLETAVEAHAVRRILCGLPSKAPALQDLRIYHRIRDVSPISSIGQLRGLRTLRIKSWSEASWFAPLMSVLAKLEHLRDLVLPLDHWDANTTETPITDSFPQLRRLKLDGLWYKGALCIGSMASNMPPARLEYLEMTRAVLNSFAEDYSAFEDLVTACAGTLSTLRVELGPGRAAGPGQGSAPMPASNLLPPLMQLRHLQLCEISLPSGNVSFTDDDLHSIREAWPLLQIFIVSCQLNPYTPDSAPSFRRVVDLLRECPRLTVLKLPAVAINGEVLYCPSVKTLPKGVVVKDDDIRDPGTFAGVMRSLFPAISVSEDALEVARTLSSERWCAVLSALKDNRIYAYTAYHRYIVTLQ